MLRKSGSGLGFSKLNVSVEPRPNRHRLPKPFLFFNKQTDTGNALKQPQDGFTKTYVKLLKHYFDECLGSLAHLIHVKYQI
jgi:hypothetical protein